MHTQKHLYIFIFILTYWVGLATPFPTYGQPTELFQPPITDQQGAPTTDTAIIHGLVRQAYVQYDQESSKKAIALFEQARLLSHRARYPDGIAEALLGLSVCYLGKGNTDRAEELLHTAKQYCQQAIYHKEQLLAEWDMRKAIPYAQNAQFDTAIYYLQQAMSRTEKAKDTLLLIRIYTVVAYAYFGNRKMDNALSYIRQAENFSLKIHNNDLLPVIYSTLSSLYSRGNDPDSQKKVYDYATKALQISTVLQNRSLQGRALSQLGIYYLAHKKTDSAFIYLNAAAQLYDPDNPYSSFHNTWCLSAAYSETGDFEQARRYGLQALEIIHQTGHRNMPLAQLYKHLAMVHHKIDAYKDAYNYEVAYAELNDSLNRVERNKAVDQLEVQYRTAAKDQEITRQKLAMSRQQTSIKQKNIQLLAIAASTLLFAAGATLLYFLYRNYKNKQRYQAEILRNMEREYEINQLKAIMKGEEQERTRIAQELHDGIGGMLASLKIRLSIIREEHPTLLEDPKVDSFTNVLSDTADEIRKTAHNLMPEVLANHTLKEALLLYCQNMGEGERFQATLQYYADIRELNKATELFLYRIVQELLQNVVKHAEAQQAVVQLMLHENILSILVEDDGKGFNGEEQMQHKGTGLSNIRLRIEALRGYFSLYSGKGGQGSTVHIEFNYEELVQLSQNT